MRSVLLLAGVLLCAASGCGGEEGEVTDVMNRHMDAIADGDGKAACRDLTAEAKRLVVVSVRATAPGTGIRSCEEAYERISANLDPAVRDRVRNEGHDVELHGDGTATVDSEATTGETQLRKDGDRWVITRINFGS